MVIRSQIEVKRFFEQVQNKSGQKAVGRRQKAVGGGGRHLTGEELNSLCLLPTPFCLLPSAYCLLPTAFCLLPTAFCLLPSAFCLLPTAYCLLPSAFCLLSTAYCC